MIDITPQIQYEIDHGALFVVNHSGGKDSQAMAELIRQSPIPDEQIVVIHAKLPEVDWEGIPEHIESNTQSAWPIIYTQAGKTFFDMVERRFESRPEVPCWPSPSTRQCTSDLKRGPIDKAVRHLIKSMPDHSKRVVHCIGIRAQESSCRAKAIPWKYEARDSKAGRTIHQWLPIHDLSETQVRNVISDAGQELHWAYSKGMSRLSCCFCIMANQSDLSTAAQIMPNLFDRYKKLEEKTGYTMSMSQKPLKELIPQCQNGNKQNIYHD